MSYMCWYKDDRHFLNDVVTFHSGQYIFWWTGAIRSQKRIGKSIAWHDVWKRTVCRSILLLPARCVRFLVLMFVQRNKLAVVLVKRTGIRTKQYKDVKLVVANASGSTQFVPTISFTLVLGSLQNVASFLLLIYSFFNFMLQCVLFPINWMHVLIWQLGEIGWSPSSCNPVHPFFNFAKNCLCTRKKIESCFVNYITRTDHQHQVLSSCLTMIRDWADLKSKSHRELHRQYP